MTIFKKIIILFFVWLYLYDQSIFSHLLIIDQHHETKTTSQDHIHESGETHDHTNKSIEFCKESDCESTCKNIETSKLISYQPNKLFSEFEEGFGKIHSPTTHTWYVYLHQIYCTYRIVVTGPPTPIEELMSRIGPVVRII